MNNIEVDKIYTFKLNSGEELISKVVEVDKENNQCLLSNPASVAPGPQGMGLVPSMFTASPDTSVRLSFTSVAMLCETDESVQDKYREATSGIQVPDKKLILG